MVQRSMPATATVRVTCGSRTLDLAYGLLPASSRVLLRPIGIIVDVTATPDGSGAICRTIAEPRAHRISKADAPGSRACQPSRSSSGSSCSSCGHPTQR